MEKPKPRNSTNKPTAGLRGALGITLGLKGTLYQEPRVKSEDLFFLEKHPFRENAYLYKKFQGIFVRKNFVLRFLLVLIHPCFLTSTSATKN